MRSQVLFFGGLLAAAYLARCLRELAVGRRLWRHGADTDYQGNGWRWTLSLLLPGVPMPWWRLDFEGGRRWGRPYRGGGTTVPTVTWHLDLEPLTTAQRRAVWAEWYATQQWYASQTRPDQGGTP